MINDDNYQRARLLVGILHDHGFPSRLVGGCVRDHVLGISPQDYDIATMARPEEVQEVFRHLDKPRVKVVPSGIAHGTVTLVLDHHPFQATTLRSDVATDGRRATVAFEASFQADAARRDFTINALSEDLDGTIHDYFSGRAHLAQKKIVFIGSPTARIREDYLRILRFFRFKSRFDLSADSETFAAITAEREGLRKISKERITMELWAMLACPRVDLTLQEMAAARIFEVIVPELAGGLTRALFCRLAAVRDDLFGVTPSLRPAAQVASWLFLLGKQTAYSELTGHLKLSNRHLQVIFWSGEGFAQLKYLSTASQAQLMGFLDHGDRYCGRREFLPYLFPLWQSWLSLQVPGAEESTGVALARIAACERTKYGLRSHFPVSGKLITSWTGIAAGPQVGKLLVMLKEGYRNEEWQSLDQARKIVREMIARGADHL